jgi:hypothetical protein
VEGVGVRFMVRITDDWDTFPPIEESVKKISDSLQIIAEELVKMNANGYGRG